MQLWFCFALHKIMNVIYSDKKKLNIKLLAGNSSCWFGFYKAKKTIFWGVVVEVGLLDILELSRLDHFFLTFHSCHFILVG